MLYIKEANIEDAEKEWLFVAAMPADENGLTNKWHGVTRDSFISEALPEIINRAKGIDLPEGFVPDTTLFLWNDTEIVGQFRLRHSLPETKIPGHIGYFIAKEHRGKGFATEGLRLTLDYGAGIIPEDEYYMRLNKDNPASLRVMLKNGGRIVEQTEDKLIVKIPKYKNHNITSLEKEKWKGFNLPIGYTTNEYYDVTLTQNERGFDIGIIKKAFPAPVTHSQEEYDYPDKLYADWWEKAEAFGVAENGRLLAAIEICPEDWTNRLIVTELWVSEELRGKGYGKKLIDLAKAETRRRKHRALILETQSCNVNAVDFYLHQGFRLIGLDTCCYANNDPARKEVRLNLGWFPEKADFDMETASGKTNALLQTSDI